MLFKATGGHGNSGISQTYGPIAEKRDFSQKNFIKIKMLKNGTKKDIKTILGNFPPYTDIYPFGKNFLQKTLF